MILVFRPQSYFLLHNNEMTKTIITKYLYLYYVNDMHNLNIILIVYTSYVVIIMLNFFIHIFYFHVKVEIKNKIFVFSKKLSNSSFCVK